MGYVCSPRPPHVDIKGMKSRLLALFLALGSVAGILAAPGHAATTQGPRHPAADHPHPADLPAGAEQPPTGLVRRALDRLATATRAMASDAPQTAPMAGTFHVPVLLVDFSDNPAEESLHRPDDYQAMLFGTDYPLGAGSLADYYRDQSHGLLQVTGEVTSSWLRMPRTYGTYIGSRNGYQTSEPNDWTLVKDAVDAADPGIDFCRSDRDRNGLVDTMFIVHAGAGAEEAGSGLWSLRWSLPVAYPTRDVCADGRRMSVKQFTLEPEEYARTSFTAPGAPERLVSVGVFIHEFGHALGLPDLYDTDYSSPGGVGPWDVMATGAYGFDGRSPWMPVPLSAWSKVALGWVTPRTITADTVGIEIRSSDSASQTDPGTVLKIVPSGFGAGEYFLVENRTRDGWAAGLPASGLAVWRVNASVANNDDDSRRVVQLVQGDGYDELGIPGSSGRGDSGDLLPGSSGVRGIDQSTLPSTDLTGGRDSYVAIWSIGDPGDVTTTDIYMTPGSPRPALDDTVVTPDDPAVPGGSLDKVIPAITALSDWPEPFTPNGDDRNDETHIRFWVTQDAPVTVVVRRDGRRIRKLIDHEPGDSGYRTVMWDGINARGHIARAGTYTYRITTADDNGVVTAVAKGTTTLRR